MVDVTLFGPKDFRNVKALIDTGADDCLIHGKIGTEACPLLRI
jgi:hypothetical protein